MLYMQVLTMDNIIGQPGAIDMLSRQVQQGRLHHAYIFHGPSGVGKFTTALSLAQLALCHDRQTDLTGRPSACGVCPSCRVMKMTDLREQADDDDADETKSSRGKGKGKSKRKGAGQIDVPAVSHPDVQIITRRLAAVSSNSDLRRRKMVNLPIDLLREYMVGGNTGDGRYHEPVAFRAASLGHGRAFIIDEAELLDQYGQNALLKTLEEPAPGSLNILVCRDEQALLPTVRSRCHRVGFARLSDEAVRKRLEKLEPGLSEAERSWLVRFADGSFGRLELAVAYDLAQWGRQLSPRLEHILHGKSAGDLGSVIHSLIDGFAGEYVDGQANASKESANQMAVDLMWSSLARFAREQLRKQADQCTADDPVAADARVEPWIGIIDELSRARTWLRSNVNLALVCEHVGVQINLMAAR